MDVIDNSFREFEPADPESKNGSEEELRKCPFFPINCITFCPMFVEPHNDCMFQLCLTDVQEIFFAVARYVDERLGIPDGDAFKYMEQMKHFLEANPTQEEIILAGKGVLNAVGFAGIVSWLADRESSEMEGFMSGVSDLVVNLRDLFTKKEAPEQEQAPEQKPGNEIREAPKY